MRTELLLIFVGVIAAMSVVSLVVMQVILRGANDLIYEQSAEILNLTTRFVEDELRQVDSLTYEISTDLQVQDALETLDSTTQPYDRRQAADRMENLLLPYALQLPEVASVHLLDMSMGDYSAGRENIILPQSLRDELAKRLKPTNGVNEFIVTNPSAGYLTAGRLVRKIKGLSLAPIGYLFVRVNLHMLVAPYLSLLPGNAVKLAIIAPQGVIYSNVGPLDVARVVRDRGARYAFMRIGRRRYFSVLKRSSYTGWLFLNMLDYSSVERRTLALRLLVGSAILLLSAACAVVALGFTRRITRPLEDLSAHLRIVEGGNFVPADETRLTPATNSEIHVFYRNFNTMIRRIDALIDDNYRKKMQLLDSDFRMLQAQINPHFLYNTLDSINWIARMNGQESISVMVKALSNLLRRSISRTNGVVSLAEELDTIQSYITIQRVRFGERLRFSLNVEEGLTTLLLPPFTLQPLVENAIVHGLERKAGPCAVGLRAGRRDGGVEIEVSDDGPGMPQDRGNEAPISGGGPSGRGVGLANVRERLRLFFGEKAGLVISSRPAEGTIVRLFIPQDGRGEGRDA